MSKTRAGFVPMYADNGTQTILLLSANKLTYCRPMSPFYQISQHDAYAPANAEENAPIYY